MTIRIITISIMTISIMTISIMIISIMIISIMTISIMTITIMTITLMTISVMALDPEGCYAECHLCWVSFILSVTNKPSMLSVILLSVVALARTIKNFCYH